VSSFSKLCHTRSILIAIFRIGGPFSKDGAIGSQFDAAKDGLAGQVEVSYNIAA